MRTRLSEVRPSIWIRSSLRRGALIIFSVAERSLISSIGSNNVEVIRMIVRTHRKQKSHES